MSTIADKTMSIGSYLGSAVAIFSGLTLTEWGIIFGIITAAVTCVANLIYQSRKNHREEVLHALEVKRICSLSPDIDDSECKSNEHPTT